MCRLVKVYFKFYFHSRKKKFASLFLFRCCHVFYFMAMYILHTFFYNPLYKKFILRVEPFQIYGDELFANPDLGFCRKRHPSWGPFLSTGKEFSEPSKYRYRTDRSGN